MRIKKMKRKGEEKGRGEREERELRRRLGEG